MKASDDFFEKPECIVILNGSTKNGEKNLMIDRCEKLMNITLQSKTLLCVVSASFAQPFFESIDCFVCAFSFSARERMGYEGWLEDGIQNLKDCMMQHAISHRGFMDAALLWIANGKGGVLTVFVLMRAEISMKRKDVLFEFPFKFLHILPRIFPFAKFFPGQE